MPRLVDLDSNATTPVHPDVLSLVVDTMRSVWGNASSDNSLGQAARCVVHDARDQVAKLIHANSDEIVFTSGATESINLAIQGIVRANPRRPAHVITTNVEHKAVLETIYYLAEEGLVVPTIVAADSLGVVSAHAVENALRDNTLLVCMIHGNNEIGTVNPIEEVGAILRNHPSLFFVDAAQTLGYIPVSVPNHRIDALCISGHKMHGPKGVGALFLRDQVPVSPLLHGGAQERGFRPGTLNTPGIAGLGRAAALSSHDLQMRSEAVKRLSAKFLNRLREAVPTIRLNGHPTQRLPGLLSITVPSVEYRELRIRLDPKKPKSDFPRICFSHGSACTDSSRPSHVLQAIGLTQAEAMCTFRVGINSLTAEDDVVTAADCFIDAIRRLLGR